MREIEAIEDWVGQDVVDPAGEKVGKLDEVWFRAGDDDPVLISVKSGILGRKHNLVPLEGSTLSREYVRVNWSKDEVQEGPSPDSDAALTLTDLGRVGDHYGVDIDGPDNAQLESGSARTARFRAAEAAVARADELEAEAARADDEAKLAAQRAEAARVEAGEAETRRTQAYERAEQARAKADAALAPAGMESPRHASEQTGVETGAAAPTEQPPVRERAADHEGALPPEPEPTPGRAIESDPAAEPFAAEDAAGGSQRLGSPDAASPPPDATPPR